MMLKAQRIADHFLVGRRNGIKLSMFTCIEWKVLKVLVCSVMSIFVFLGVEDFVIVWIGTSPCDADENMCI